MCMCADEILSLLHQPASQAWCVVYRSSFLDSCSLLASSLDSPHSRYLLYEILLCGFAFWNFKLHTETNKRRINHSSADKSNTAIQILQNIQVFKKFKVYFKNKCSTAKDMSFLWSFSGIGTIINWVTRMRSPHLMA